MKTFFTAAAAVAALGFAPAAFAQTTTDAQTPSSNTTCRPTDPCYDVVPTAAISNTQRMDGFNTILNATVNTTIGRATDAVTVAATSIGNNFKAEGRSSGAISSSQIFEGEAYAKLNAKIGDAAGKVALNSTAIANNTSLDVRQAGAIKLDQQILNRDPSAIVNADLGSMKGGLDVSAVAGGNIANVNADTIGLTSNQYAHAAPIMATTNVTVGDVAGKVDLAATAIGNSLTIKGF